MTPQRLLPIERGMSDDINRDMSLIEFERRVLEEARDERNPLLERIKFLGILGRNLDEFVMVRGRTWMASPSARRLTRKTHALLRDGYRVLRRDLLPALAKAGIAVVDYSELSAVERADVDEHFECAFDTFAHLVGRIRPIRNGDRLEALPVMPFAARTRDICA